MEARMKKFVLLVAAALAAASAALAQGGGTIVSLDATFERAGSSPFGGDPAANFTGVAVTLATDHVFDYGWWIRASGDSHENPLGTPDSYSYNGDMSTIDWNSVTSAGLAVEEQNFVVDTGVAGAADGGFVAGHLMVTNPGQTNVTIDVFHYLDMDLGGTSAGDLATVIEYPNLIQITDQATGITANYVGVHADSWQVGAFPSIRNLLNDGSPTNFDHGGLPFGPGDFTGGFQWEKTLAPGQSAIFNVGVSVLSTFHCNAEVGVFCDGFESGDTLFWSHAQP
jgi:hypothetical protein